MIGIKSCILLHPVGNCEPTHLSLAMGRPPIRGTTAVNLDLSSTGLQNLPNHIGTALA
jgi:hypothetical protein